MDKLDNESGKMDKQISNTTRNQIHESIYGQAGECHSPRRKTAIFDALTSGTRVTLIGVGLAFVSGFFGKMHWLPELLSHFVAHLTVVTFGCLILLLFARLHYWSAGAAVLLAAELIALAPYLVDDKLKASTTEEGAIIRVLQFNVNEQNSDWRKFIDWLRPRMDSLDVIVLLENTPSWSGAMRILKETFPEFIEEVRSDSYGIAVFSRLPESKLELRDLGPDGNPAVELRARLGGQSFTLIAAHTSTPLGKRASEVRNAQLFELADWIVDSPPGYKILLGDLNVTPFSPWFRGLSEAAKLTDAQYGLGLLPTWAPWPIPTSLGLPIDHTLVSSNLSVVERRRGDRFGSDHCPIITGFRI